MQYNTFIKQVFCFKVFIMNNLLLSKGKFETKYKKMFIEWINVVNRTLPIFCIKGIVQAKTQICRIFTKPQAIQDVGDIFS